MKDIIHNNYGVALATADLVSELGRLSLRWWLGEQYKESKIQKFTPHHILCHHREREIQKEIQKQKRQQLQQYRSNAKNVNFIEDDILEIPVEGQRI